jgi:hypothetical protein
VAAWQLSRSLRTDPGPRCPKNGLWTTQRLPEAGAVTSVGSTGDSYDSLAEATNSPIKAELVRNMGPWRSIDDLEIALAGVHELVQRFSVAFSEATYLRRRSRPTSSERLPTDGGSSGRVTALSVVGPEVSWPTVPRASSSPA